MGIFGPLPQKIAHSRLLPLCIDLDGTLIKEDVTWAMVSVFMKQYPRKWGALLMWLLRGRAYLKSNLSQHVSINPKDLTYNQALLDLMTTERQRGRLIVLATAADTRTAKRVADYLGIFDEVMATNSYTNLRATKKSQALCKRFGEKQFIYIGNSKDDLKVASKAALFILISQSNHLRAKAQHIKQTPARCLHFNEKIQTADLELMT